MKFRFFSPHLIFIVLLLLFPTDRAGAQNDWQTFPGARLLVDEPRDGDSFVVEFQRNGKIHRQIVRLYFVDAPESAAAADADRRRVVEQMRYFGVESPALVLEVGMQAAEFNRELLAEPFIVRTAFATAPGRSATSRIYAMITTADGRDLGAALVESGMARARGMARSLPDGTPAAEHTNVMADMEVGAMLGRKGLWQHADAARIAQLRAREREEARLLREAFSDPSDEAPRINLNTATKTQLRSLHGIGKTLSARIIEHRPFASVEDLLKVPGISQQTLDNLRDRLSVE